MVLPPTESAAYTQPARGFTRPAQLHYPPRMRALLVVFLPAAFVAALPGSFGPLPPPTQTSCSAVASLNLPNTKITSASEVAAGAFAPPGGPSGTSAYEKLPAFCRVAATLTPSSDSDIKVEVWLPSTGWNGKLQSVGNGAWQGSIGYAAMAEALGRGYATASTDTGHVGGSASFGMGHPEKVIDFAYRAVHEMTVVAKAIVSTTYGRGPTRSYWNGCSAGGRQAMKEAQMYPGDYDGIIAGSPGLDWSGRTAQAIRIAHALQRPEARLSSAQTSRLHEAALSACDGNDGLKDRLIANPATCRFDPQVLSCAGGSEAPCLTPAQVETVRMIYSPLVDPKTKREIPGLSPGSELGWTDMGWSASARATGLDHFRFLIFGDPTWDVQRFNATTDVPRLAEGPSGAIDARDINLRPFFDRGGKLLQYHGWSDPQITPLASTQYFDRVVAAQGDAAKLRESYRLFMAPGMAHCRGGEGPDDFDEVTVLEAWVEHGKAPDAIIASRSRNGRVDRTRPLCPYPQIATYRGSGSIDDATNFVCR
jgi:feruloyl esterase